MYLYLILLCRQTKKKKTTASENKATDSSILVDTKNTSETNQDNKVEDGTDEQETKVDESIEKELIDAEPHTSPLKNENEIIADESLADVESLPESQPEQTTKSSKSSKRSSERKSKSRSSRASKYVMKREFVVLYLN